MSMSCAEAEPLLPLVADGALDPDSDADLFAHLAACPACQRAVASHDLIGLALRTPVRRARRPILHLWPYAAAAAAALVALAIWATGTAPAAAVATPPPIAQAPAPPATPPPAAVPHVVAITQADGTRTYLVQTGDGWTVVDPANLDTGTNAAQGTADGVQVRH